MTRSKLIQVWFAAVALLAVAWIVFGVAMTVSTGVMLLGLSLTPPIILLVLWPRVQPPTAAEVLHGTESRARV